MLEPIRDFAKTSQGLQESKKAESLYYFRTPINNASIEGINRNDFSNRKLVEINSCWINNASIEGINRNDFSNRKLVEINSCWINNASIEGINRNDKVVSQRAYGYKDV